MRDQQVGSIVRTLREAKGMSQQELADAMALTQPVISSLELGHRRWTVEKVEAVAQALDVDPGELTGWASDADAFAIASALRDGCSVVVYAPGN